MLKRDIVLLLKDCHSTSILKHPDFFRLSSPENFKQMPEIKKVCQNNLIFTVRKKKK